MKELVLGIDYLRDRVLSNLLDNQDFVNALDSNDIEELVTIACDEIPQNEIRPVLHDLWALLENSGRNIVKESGTVPPYYIFGNVSIADNWTKGAKTIYPEAVVGLSLSKENFDIMLDGIQEIQTNAFYQCDLSNASISIPDSVTTIEERAFGDIDEYFKDIYIGDGVKQLRPGALRLKSSKIVKLSISKDLYEYLKSTDFRYIFSNSDKKDAEKEFEEMIQLGRVEVR